MLACARFAGQVKLPEIPHQVLPNGILTDLMPRAGGPVVGFRILVKGGPEADPANLAGRASVTAQLLRKGTAKRSADEFSEELDLLGGTFLANAGGEGAATTIGGEFLKKDFDRGLDLLADAVLHPTFPEAEVRKALAQRVDGAKSIKDNPQGAITGYFAAFFFGPNHPYGRPSDELTLARIQRQDVLDFHARQYCGRNMVVIVTGDFDSSAAAAKIREAFGGAAPGQAFEGAKTAAIGVGAKLLLVDKPDATQTYFYIAQPGIDRKSADRVKLLLVNTLFGGRFTSMLNEALRVNSALSYGANCQLQASRLPRGIGLTTYTRTDTTGKAIDGALEARKERAGTGITAEHLAATKRAIKRG